MVSMTDQVYQTALAIKPATQEGHDCLMTVWKDLIQNRDKMAEAEKITRPVARFKKLYPMKDWDGDAQEFFETVDETDLINLFRELYKT